MYNFFMAAFLKKFVGAKRLQAESSYSYMYRPKYLHYQFLTFTY